MLAEGRDDLKSMIIEAFYDYLKNKGYEDIHSIREDMDSPESIKDQNNNKEYIPDITARKNKRKDFFKIELQRDSSKDDTIEKYRTLLTTAKKARGKFYVIVPNERFESTLQLINQNNLVSIGIIRINLRNMAEV